MSARPKPVETARIVDATADGRGVARLSGKAVFVDGALAGETVSFVRRKKRRNYDEADLVDVIEPSDERVVPRCAVFGTCGGCSLQHVSAERQLVLKQGVLLDNLKRIGDVEPRTVLPAVTGPVWGYRRKARLAVKYVLKKERVLVGFRERYKPYIVDMTNCETLHRDIAALLPELAGLIGTLTIRQRVPQIEVAVGENAAALVFRVLDPPSQGDLAALKEFQLKHGVRVMLQPGGLESIQPLPAETDAEALYYTLPEYSLRLSFQPTDFLQVNAEVNAKAVRQAIELLAPTRESRVLDLFCGLGNFTLPMATRAGEVLGLEFDGSMVERARRNADAAKLGNVRFEQADLYEPQDAAAFPNCDLVLLDPPRTGAQQVLGRVAAMSPRKILYISCHPGTLARDARELVHEFGFDLAAAGVVDMFGQTSHVESMALFQR